MFNRLFNSVFTTIVLLSAYNGQVVAEGGQQLDSAAATEAQCDPATGLTSPIKVCSLTDRCILSNDKVVVTSSDKPACWTSLFAGRPLYNDGPARKWSDSDGTIHYACEYRPPGTSTTSQRPMVIFLHGSGARATDVYNATSLRTKARDFDLSGDPARPGFVLVSVQGRNLHWPADDFPLASRHDHLYRDLAAPSTNRDVAHIDHLIDTLVGEGIVDPEHIYIMGHSNGGNFAQFYAIARHEYPTPGGNRVTATAVYSAADPFHNIRSNQMPSCRLDPYPTSRVPVFVVSRSCDLIACSEEQDAAFRTAGLTNTPGLVVQTWMADLSTKVQNPNGRWRIINGLGGIVPSCTPAPWCSLSTASNNHRHWPDGIADHSGIDHEADMLAFLAQHATLVSFPGQWGLTDTTGDIQFVDCPKAALCKKGKGAATRY